MVVLKGKFAKQTAGSTNCAIQHLTSVCDLNGQYSNSSILHGRRADFRNIGQGVNIGRDKSALMANTQNPQNTQNAQNAQNTQNAQNAQNSQNTQNAQNAQPEGVPA